jgi:site-specific DNA recombinase
VDLEKHFFDSLKDYLVTPDKVSAYLDGANTALAEKTELLESLHKEHQKVGAEAEQVYQLYMEKGLNVAQFKQRYQPLDARKLQLEEEMPRVEAELALLKVDGLTSEYIMAEATDLHARWPKMAPDEKRKIVELLTQTIVIAKDGISLNLYYLPGFEEMTNGQRTLLCAWHLPNKALP